MFHESSLQSGIALAVQQSKAVLCFVYDNTGTSKQWEETLNNEDIQRGITAQTVALRLQEGSQEAAFLSGICPVNSTPAVIVIKNAQVAQDLQSAQVDLEALTTQLRASFGAPRDPTSNGVDLPEAVSSEIPGSQHAGFIDLPAPTGQMRLPNNAYDAFRTRTAELVGQGVSSQEILEQQLDLLQRIPVFRQAVASMRAKVGKEQPTLSADVRERLLRMPGAIFRKAGSSPASSAKFTNEAVASPSTQGAGVNVSATETTPDHVHNTASSRPVVSTLTQEPVGDIGTSRQASQRADYIHLQREREQSQRDERERIKAQIKADREERRRREQTRKQSFDQDSVGATRSIPKSTEVRVQVRTFDGSTLRQSFLPDATISKDLRPWIDSTTGQNAPYNLKIILTPLPNKNIEASEEEQELYDLGIRNSCTLVMVPVKGYVESYTGSTPGGLVGSAVSAGYNVVTGTTGALFSGVRSIFGYATSNQARAADTPSTVAPQSAAENAQVKPRVRTLADQRAEAAKKDQQFYNGNQLNFEPRKDDDATKNE